MTAREAAYRSLIRIEKEGRYSNLETDVTLRAGELPENEGRLYTRLVYGTIERKLTLDYILAPLCVGIPYPKLDLEVRVILRLSAYQLLYADRIPSSAAVNEGVNLCKRYRKSAASMVNAVLRRLCREKEQIVFPEPEADPVLYLSTFYSVSPELCRLFLSDMGFAECVRMLEAVNAQAGVFTTLRVNTLKLSREEFCKRLEERGIPFEKTVLSPTGVRPKADRPFWTSAPAPEENPSERLFRWKTGGSFALLTFTETSCLWFVKGQKDWAFPFCKPKKRTAGCSCLNGRKKRTGFSAICPVRAWGFYPKSPNCATRKRRRFPNCPAFNGPFWRTPADT